MGWFNRRKAPSGGAILGPSALVVSSEMATDVEHRTGVERDHSVRESSFNALNLGTIPHRLLLEVTVPGREPFQVRRASPVPAKATGRTGFELPPGLRLPVVVRHGGATDDVDIDWDAFFAMPDWKAQVTRASARRSAAEATAYTEAVPGLKEQAWASAAQGTPMWMEAVRQRKLKRNAFDQQVDTLVRIGQMDPELAAEAKRTLDAEGFTR